MLERSTAVLGTLRLYDMCMNQQTTSACEQSLLFKVISVKETSVRV